MKKYVFLGLLGITGCSNPGPKSYICVNPFMLLQSFTISTDHPAVKENSDSIELTADDGTTIVLPKALCAEVRRNGP